MKIEGLDLAVVRIPYKQHIVWGSREADGDDYVILRIRTDEGIDGWAQTLETTTWSGQTAYLTTHVIRELFEPALIGQDPLRPERMPFQRVQGWGSVKGFVEKALCELQAKALGLPVWKYLGGWTNQVPVAWLVNRGSSEEMLRDAAQAIENYGFRSMKVKVGGNAAEDIEGVRRIHAAFPDLVMWMDGNGTYSWEEALRVADELSDQGVALFEDPTRLFLTERTRQMIARCAIPVMWDRGMNNAEDAERCIDLGAAAVNLKVGSYREARRVVETCEARGTPCIVGVGSETALHSLGSLHFRGAFRWLEGFAAENSFFLKLADDVLEEPIQVNDGVVTLSDAPGFGVRINQKVVEKYRVA